MYFPLENRGYFRSSVRWNYWSVISGWCKISYARSLLSKYSCYPSPKGPRANKLNNNFKMKPSSRKCLISHITKITYSQYHLKKYIKNSESAFTSIATGTFLEGNPFKPLFATVFGWLVDPTDMFFFWGSLLWNCPSLGTDPRESNGKKQILVFFLDAPNLSHVLNLGSLIGENVVPLGWRAPARCLNLPRSPWNGDIPSKGPLYEVYMGLMIKGTIPRVPAFPYDYPQ